MSSHADDTRKCPRIVYANYIIKKKENSQCFVKIFAGHFVYICVVHMLNTIPSSSRSIGQFVCALLCSPGAEQWDEVAPNRLAVRYDLYVVYHLLQSQRSLLSRRNANSVRVKYTHLDSRKIWISLNLLHQFGMCAAVSGAISTNTPQCISRMYPLCMSLTYRILYFRSTLEDDAHLCLFTNQWISHYLWWLRMPEYASLQFGLISSGIFLYNWQLNQQSYIQIHVRPHTHSGAFGVASNRWALSIFD